MSLLEKYVDIGFALIEVYPGEKRPIGNSWQHHPIESHTDLKRLVNKNIGLHHEKSKTVTLDIDHPEYTHQALKLIGVDLDSLLAAPGPKIKNMKSLKPLYRLPRELEPVLKQLKFVNPKNKKENVTVFELRGKGQDLLPPSVHPDGHLYQWVEQPQTREDIPELPPALIRLLKNWVELSAIMQEASPWYQAPKPKKAKSSKASNTVIDNYNEVIRVEEVLERNDYEAIGDRYLAPSSSGDVPGVVILEDKCYSHHASDPLNDTYSHNAFDTMKILECAGNFGTAMDKAREHLGLPGRSSSSKKAAPRSRTPNLIYMDTVEAEEVNFFWRPYIPLGKLTMLEGDPGIGKSSLCLWLASILTNETSLPICKPESSELSYQPPAIPCSSVVYMTAEDGLADTLKPRLEALGADCSKVIALKGYTEEVDGQEEERSVTLKDVDVIEAALIKTSAKLIIVDPIQGYMGSGVDSHRANDVRPILSKLGDLAEKYECAIVCIRHLSKSNKGGALHRGLGSVDFTAIARSQLVVGMHEGQRVMAHVKSSLAKNGSSLIFDITKSGLEWIGGTDATAEDVAFTFTPDNKKTRISKREEAEEFLLTILEDEPQPKKVIDKKASKEGISSSALKQAKKNLGIESYRVQEPGGTRGEGEWFWRLDQNSPPAGQGTTDW